MVRPALPLLIAITLACVLLTSPPQAAGGTQGTSGTPTLKDTLEKGLKARTAAEFAFVALVVHRVEEGKLPRGLVESTFLWARRKQPYPFPYFEQGLRVRAKKLGITI